ncbi:MAG TPA: M28 family peptidase [Gemmataceae bacterium]|nr:M28 family peptidase [Gemmataceae bacterium]
MAAQGWRKLLDGYPAYKGAGSYPIAAYSEFMPPAHLGRKPYGTHDPFLFSDDDPWGWHISEYEEVQELAPGLDNIGQQIVHNLVQLGEGKHHGIAKNKLTNNPYWPDDLAEHAGKLRHERYLVLLPLALSRTQDDKGRLRWTLFGGSETGPSQAFWKSFYTAPGKEMPAEQALQFLRRLLSSLHGKTVPELSDLHRAGFRILPEKGDELPSWCKHYLLSKKDHIGHVQYLLSFRPFGELPDNVRHAYLEGKWHLLPFPGSLVFWGAPMYLKLQRELPGAIGIPLLHRVARHESPEGIRVPQSGWLHEPSWVPPESLAHLGPIRNTYQRTHRWARVHRHDDELVTAKEDELAHVLFSAAADDVGLYGKPMARNCQIWTDTFRLLVDGPHAGRAEIVKAARKLAAGGLFGYRFLYPAMQVGNHEVFWHRPLVAYWSGKEAVVLAEPLLGHLTARRHKPPGAHAPGSPGVELWPRLLKREAHLAGLELFNQQAWQPHQTSLNVRKLLNVRYFFPSGVPDSFARQLLACPKHETLHEWLDSLPMDNSAPERCRRLIEEMTWKGGSVTGKKNRSGPKSLTFARTAKRSYEVHYWNTIATLAHGAYKTKDNADCVDDPATKPHLPHQHRDLEALGDYLLDYYQRLVARHKVRKALVGDLPFYWQTDFEYSWSGGWLKNQQEQPAERDLLVVIPGKDRKRAVIMADHYDTAYMEDRYYKDRGGIGARLAAAGADDNHSATAALMLGAEVFLELSKAGKLACDIWLVHLTGEEFPSDCLGARHLCQKVVEGNLKIRLKKGGWQDLSNVRIQGVYVLDMVAHNNDHNRDIFQISPGTGPESLWLAYQAHLANEAWNASVPGWNRKPARKDCARGQRSANGKTIPVTALHPQLSGEVRLPYTPRSTLFNTDGQIFSDAGVPVVLFMENYDINRQGYHDTHDNMENIDLDYGAAVSAIAIESVARAATEKPWKWNNESPTRKQGS